MATTSDTDEETSDSPAPPNHDESVEHEEGSAGDDDDGVANNEVDVEEGDLKNGNVESETATNGDSAPVKKDGMESRGGTDDKGDDDDMTEDEKALAIARAKVVAEAAAEADSSYIPSQSVLNATNSRPLLSQVDGPALSTYETSDNVYQAKAIPVALRAKLDVPIHVTVGGSVVEYTIETDAYDISFGITADRGEEGDAETVIVRELERVDSHLNTISGKFLVGSVPCALVFTFDNSYSWFREKAVTYHIKVTPPPIENVIAGRRRRAQSALKTVEKDKESAEKRLTRAMRQREGLEGTITKLQKQLAEQQKSLDVVQKEESWLTSRVNVRTQQIDALLHRLQYGWDDEGKGEQTVEGASSTTVQKDGGGDAVQGEEQDALDDGQNNGDEELKNEEGHYEI